MFSVLAIPERTSYLTESTGISCLLQLKKPYFRADLE